MGLRKATAVIAAALVIAAPSLAGFSSAEGETQQTSEPEDDPDLWRIYVRALNTDGKLAGEIILEGRPVIRIRSSAGGLDAVARAMIVAERLRQALQDFPRLDFKASYWKKSGPLVLWLNDLPLVTVDSETAKCNNSTPVSLAVDWSRNVAKALNVTSNLDVGSGIASWYGPGFHGLKTASGEIFNSRALTAAHRELPFGTVVKVTSLTSGRTVSVKINDRGPWVDGRVIDLSRGAAERLGLISSGVAPVKIEVEL